MVEVEETFAISVPPVVLRRRAIAVPEPGYYQAAVPVRYSEVSGVWVVVEVAEVVAN